MDLEGDPERVLRPQCWAAAPCSHHRVRRGVFQDLDQLITAIGDYIDANNKNSKPFTSTPKANDILEKETRALTALSRRRSA